MKHERLMVPFYQRVAWDRRRKIRLNVAIAIGNTKWRIKQMDIYNSTTAQGLLKHEDKATQ